MHVQASLQAALSRAGAAGRRLCVLLDTAHAEGAHLQLERRGISYESLFDGTTEENLREIAPLLIFPDELEQHAQARLIAWLERSAYSAPCVSWFETQLPPARIAEHLRRFHVVGIPDDQSMIMRWYDTRILPVWFACLGPAQGHAFVGDTSAWHYVDRFGDVRPLTVDADVVVDALPEPSFGKPWIELDAAQYGLLVDAADLTTMLARMRTVIPDEIKRVPARTLAQFVARQQGIAAASGLRDPDRQAQYVLLALYTSGRAAEQAELQAFLKSAPQAFDAFYQGLQALSDAVWEAGPPLWADKGQTTPADNGHLGLREVVGAR